MEMGPINPACSITIKNLDKHTMVVFPNAKINIGLHITQKRSDGYHNVESCFYPIDWTDALEIAPSERLTCTISGMEVPGNVMDNLCIRAYHLLRADYNLPPIDLHLLKAIPIGAGLGGGSADATFTLKALNKLEQLNLSEEALIQYARQLGSDCAFFVKNKPVFSFHKGDEFEPMDLSLKGRWIAVINPGIHISTAEAYAGIRPRRPACDLRDILKTPIQEWKDQVINDFEAPLARKHPTIAQIKAQLYEAGALYASMTGSGSTVYGFFENETNFYSSFVNYNSWYGIMK
ncbi:4-(cytidine 5'-diphospho)-2-C-methyl-D-erythritol kinase [Dyadobacter tibetensis]|uniref:4-(cytidine 5'-diphospho)-2-C-methyl-D-erythritol kinase n=1 Tax=Dyadobacter tibetensis TaxID=1211851 RepID=UPI0004AF1871|nr:4-(cytidine 5'-diphospho)-2-C-methyl-D-erythritol kinase [Dyadobacter tibetensis]